MNVHKAGWVCSGRYRSVASTSTVYEAQCIVILYLGSVQQQRPYCDDLLTHATRSTSERAVIRSPLRYTYTLGGRTQTASQHLCTAAALNLLRLDAFLAEQKVAKIWISRFATLAPVALAW